MSEETSGAMGGAMQGASTGAAFGPWGAVIGGVVGGVAGFFGGNSAKKKRIEAERRAAEARQQIVGIINEDRARNSDFLDDQKAKMAEDTDKIIEQYQTMQTRYYALKETNADLAEERYGGMMAQMDDSLKQQLGLSDEMFTQLQTSTQNLYSDERDYIMADLADNSELRDDFRVVADENIDRIRKANKSVEQDLDKLTGRGGKPEYYDNEMSKLDDRVQQIDTQTDRMDAGRNRSGQYDRKLTNAFNAAKAKGQLSAQLMQQGVQDKAQFVNQLVGLGNNAQSASQNKLQVGATNDGQVMAGLADKFGQQSIAQIADKYALDLGITDTAQRQSLQALATKYSTLQDAENAYAQGMIGEDEAAFLRNMAVYDQGIAAQRDYNESLKGTDAAMINMLAGTAQVNDSVAQSILTKYDGAMQQGSSSMGDAMGAGKFDFLKGMFGNKAPTTGGSNTPVGTGTVLRR